MAPPISTLRFCEIINPLKSKLTRLGESIKRFAYLFFQSISELLDGNVGALRWNCRERKNLKIIPTAQLPPFFPKKTLYPEPFSELAKEYQVLHGLKSESELKKRIDQKLERGFCHGKCLALLSSIQKSHSCLREEMIHLNSKGVSISFFQTLEIFRETFQRNQRVDLLDKINAFLPSGLTEEITCCSEELSSVFERALKNKNALVLMRMYNQTEGHTILIQLKPDKDLFGFYNSKRSGYYEYGNFEKFNESLMTHVHTHAPFGPSFLLSIYHSGISSSTKA